ncbi:hypothetical protein RB653_010632 [Dictyostelium firmibasis]|uniref:Uncharacterized protein n=1 Tax=Dictyostelium firmibasis TaxID=79012 RepID=A0AAN7U261_9MYCE
MERENLKGIIDASKSDISKNSDVKDDIVEHLNRKVKKIGLIFVSDINDKIAINNTVKLKKTLGIVGFECYSNDNNQLDFLNFFNKFLENNFTSNETKVFFLFYYYGPLECTGNQINLSSMVKRFNDSDELINKKVDFNILLKKLEDKENNLKKIHLIKGVVLSWEKLIILDYNNFKNPLDAILNKSEFKPLNIKTNMKKIGFIYTPFILNNNLTTTTTTTSLNSISNNNLNTTTTTYTTVTTITTTDESFEKIENGANNDEEGISIITSSLCDSIESNEKKNLSTIVEEMKTQLLNNFISKRFGSFDNLIKEIQLNSNEITTDYEKNLIDYLLFKLIIIFGSPVLGSYNFKFNKNGDPTNNIIFENKSQSSKVRLIENRKKKYLLFENNEQNENVREIKKSLSNKGIECLLFRNIESLEQILEKYLSQNSNIDFIIYFHENECDNNQLLNSIIETIKTKENKYTNNNLTKGIYSFNRNLFILDTYNKNETPKNFFDEIYKGSTQDIFQNDFCYGTAYLCSPTLRQYQDGLTKFTSSVCDRINSLDSPGRNLSELHETIRYDLLSTYNNNNIDEVAPHLFREYGIQVNDNCMIEEYLLYSCGFEIIFGDPNIGSFELIPFGNKK